MPKRTNVFQEVVAIVHRHMADDATVQESEMLVDRVSGQEREVDAVIRGSTANYEIIVSVEANARSRRASVEWVEQLIGKHGTLPTNQLILVSQAGFTKMGRALAEQKGVPAIAPESLTAPNAEYQIVSKLRSIWPKILSFTPTSFALKVEEPNGAVVNFRATEDQLIVLDDGTEVANPIHVVRAFYDANFLRIAEEVGVRDAREDREFELHIGIENPGQSATTSGLFVRREFDDGRHELHRITNLLVKGNASIHVAEVQLTHARLGSIDSAYGEARIAERDALFVITEGEQGGKLTMRVRPKPK